MSSNPLKRYMALLLAGFCLCFGLAANAAKSAKIDVCHVPPGTPGNTQLIQVGPKGRALAAHLSHRDWLVSDEMCDAIADNNCDGIPGTQAENDASCPDDGIACTVAECVGPDCVNEPNDALCDDGNPNTADSCDVTTGCVNEPVYEIGGEGPGGGIVFHVTDGGLHGLEAAPVDQTPVDQFFWEWGCESWDIAGIDNTTFFLPDGQTGAAKTAAILAECPQRPIAASVASGYVWPNGQTDGYLPDHEELDLMRTMIGWGCTALPGCPNVGGFIEDFYWGSSEANADVALGRTMEGGNSNQFSGFEKTQPARVRAIRAF